MKTRFFLVALMCLALLYLSFISISQRREVPYPEGYREWTHVGSGIIGPESPAFNRFGGIHHMYANQQAMKGYTTGSFPDGSIIVFDVKELNNDGKGNTSEGKRKFIDVMMKDVAYDSTGGWGFEEFEGSGTMGKLTDLSKAQCFSCHRKLDPKDFVISQYKK